VQTTFQPSVGADGLGGNHWGMILIVRIKVFCVEIIGWMSKQDMKAGSSMSVIYCIAYIFWVSGPGVTVGPEQYLNF
jgi:hypothetical protein